VENEVYAVLGLQVDDMAADHYRGLAISAYVHQLG
jgi:hypothetical protein